MCGNRFCGKKCRTVVDHKLNVLEAGYRTIKKGRKILSSVLLITRKASARIMVLFWVNPWNFLPPDFVDAKSLNEFKS